MAAPGVWLASVQGVVTRRASSHSGDPDFYNTSGGGLAISLWSHLSQMPPPDLTTSHRLRRAPITSPRTSLRTLGPHSHHPEPKPAQLHFLLRFGATLPPFFS